MLESQNILVLDVETLASADDCRHCGKPSSARHRSTQGDNCPGYEPIGWENKAALSLSIGCYYDYQDGQLHWFDRYTLEATLRLFVTRQPLLVSYNGIAFDFALMRAVLRHAKIPEELTGDVLHQATDIKKALCQLCDAFKAFCATSYDILAEIYKVSPYKGKGINTLDAICRENGLSTKEMDGGMAPRLWRQNRIAEVVGYNVGDVLRTKALFEMIMARKTIRRGYGSALLLPRPALTHQED
jgi:hypothetical protein